MSGTITPLAAFDNATGFYSGDVTEDAQGYLFIYSGTAVAGAVYEIANTATGYAAAPTLIASLGADGGTPGGALTIDANGDIFGVSDTGNGEIFEIVHTATGYAGAPTVLAAFNGADGISPNGPLIEDAKGDLFGTTFSFLQDGQAGGGEIFELVNTSTGYAATPTVLSQFNGVDGYEPRAGLVMDANGDLFGTTEEGPGTQEGNETVLTGQGEVFELQNTATGYAGTPSIVLALDGSGDDGAMPMSQLLLGANGDLYGDTYIGGVDAITGDPITNPDSGGGVVFDISNAAAGDAQTSEVYFHGESQTGPGSNLVEDAAGDVFGITTAGSGAIFEIQNTPTGLAGTPILLASLAGTVGSNANLTLIADADGDLIGSTTSGAADGDGAVFELVNTGFFVRPIAIAGAEADQSTSDQTPIAPFSGVTIDDPNPDQTEIVAVTPSDTANGTLVDPNAATDGANIDGGVWTITGSRAAVTADLQALEFQPTTNGVSFGQSLTTSFTVAVADSDGQAADDTKTSVVATAMAPTADLPIFTGGSISRPLNLIADAHGDLFGVETGGLTGSNSDGGIFEIANTATGYAAPVLLAGFSGLNGIGPDAPLIIDANGDLFGTAQEGGAFGGLPGGLGGGIQGGDGVVFEIKNTATGYDSTPIALASFDVTDGRDLQRAPLIMDADGDLIGESFAGGPTNQGDIFEIANSPTGYANTPTVLTSFGSTDARAPIGGLTTDAAGDLFGTTEGGGTNGEGTVFELKKTGAGYATTPIILVNFSGFTDLQTGSSLLIDANGDLFGTTGDGGANNDGTVYEILNTSTGYASTPTTLVSFDRTDGEVPTGSLMFDAKGDLLGTTSDGGAFSSTVDPPAGDGTVFEIANNNGTYASTPTVLVSLTHAEGYNPGQSLLLTASGTILGTASLGGPDDWGAVFGISGTGITLAPPTITGTMADQPVSDLATINPFASVGIADQNPDQIETVTVTPSSVANGSLADPNAANDGGADANGVWTFTGSPLAVTQDLQGLIFQPALIANGGTTTTSFTIAVTDTLGGSASDAKTSVIADTSVPSTIVTTLGTLATDGWGPLAIDAKGDLFIDPSSSTYAGAVYEIANTATGLAATPTLLANIGNLIGPPNPLYVDANGDLFGIGGGNGSGSIFEIANTATGYASTPATLAAFNGADGNGPYGPLIEDASGDLFGATSGVGASQFDGYGEVFEIANTPTVLATFDGSDGLEPKAGLVADANGDLFGVTTGGGGTGYGTVFEIANTATGYANTPTVLLVFDGQDGTQPIGPLAIDAYGNLFGATYLGGSDAQLGVYESGSGAVFEIVNTPTGYAAAPTVVSMAAGGLDTPGGGVIVDAAGDLFGETISDGGAVYEIENTPTGLASTPITLLSSSNLGGGTPLGDLVADASGDLFGTTGSGGPNDAGVLFEIPNVFVRTPSSPNGLLNLDLRQTQTVSLDELSLNPAVTTNGTLQAVDLGGGTATVGGIVNAFTITDDGGVLLLDQGAVLNAFTIDGGGGELVIDHGAVVNALTYEMDHAALLLSGGSLLTDPVTVGAGGDIAGYGAVTGAMTNNGSVTAIGGALDVTGAIAGAGTLAIENGATLELGSGVGAQQVVQFEVDTTPGAGVALLDDPIDFAGTIGGFVSGDAIAINPAEAVLNAVSLDPGGTLLTLTGSIVGGNSGTIGTLAFASPVAPTDFSVSNNDIDLNEVACFLRGTAIMTPDGEVAVEQLAVGDAVTTASGAVRSIVWIGEGRALAMRGRRDAATPLIVRKGALADNVPLRDLRITKGHALLIDGVLIPAEFLVNHRSILWDDRAQEVSVFHVELETHDILVANGAPAESYRDDGNRWLFQNANSGWDLPPQEPCAPVLTGGPVVDAIWRRLLERAGPRPGFPLTDDPDLHLLSDGARLDAVARQGEAYIFALPGRPGQLRIVSHAAAPAELGLARDPRVLGVALRSMVARQDSGFRIIASADGRLVDGYHANEPAIGMRWTDGDAVVPGELFSGLSGPFELVLHVGATARYVADRGMVA